MISGYLHQACEWAKIHSSDEWGKSVFSSPSLINCRWVFAPTLFKGLMGREDASGENSMSSCAYAIVDEKVGLGDRLTYEGNHYFVLNFKDYISISGDWIGRKVWLH